MCVCVCACVRVMIIVVTVLFEYFVTIDMNILLYIEDLTSVASTLPKNRLLDLVVAHSRQIGLKKS